MADVAGGVALLNLAQIMDLYDSGREPRAEDFAQLAGSGYCVERSSDSSSSEILTPILIFTEEIQDMFRLHLYSANTEGMLNLPKSEDSSTEQRLIGIYIPRAVDRHHCHARSAVVNNPLAAILSVRARLSADDKSLVLRSLRSNELMSDPRLNLRSHTTRESYSEERLEQALNPAMCVLRLGKGSSQAP
jgi:hypothetical protein